MAALAAIALRRNTDGDTLVDARERVRDACTHGIDGEIGLDRDLAAADVDADSVGHDGNGHRRGQRGDVADLGERIRLEAVLGPPAPRDSRVCAFGAKFDRGHAIPKSTEPATA